MTCGELSTHEVVTIEASASAASAAALMRSTHVGSLVVVDDAQAIVGILTDRDLALEVLGCGRDPQATTVATVMSRDVLTAQVDDDLWQTLYRMRRRGCRRVPVIDQTGGLCGLLAVDDILERLVVGLQDIAAIARLEPHHEARRR
ncbi:MAG: CBS domain-containing protein [Pseudomonadota bacterium]|nr:CBS domain-containing protein [Pseudomonadota bacterium]HJO36042.1 CBS domain-containing protein [Gammaproteobacteria bacterium]